MARTELFSTEPLPDVGSEVWRYLWESARLYSEESAYRGRPFPVTDSESRCTLCHQELTSEAAARFGRFENFIRGESGKRVRSAEHAYQKAREAAAGIFPAIKNLREHVSMIRDTLEDSGIAVTARRSCLIGLWRLRSALRPNVMYGDLKIPTAESAPIDELLVRRKKLEERVEALCDPRELEKMQAERDDLADRKWLSGAKEEVLKQIDQLVRIEALMKARKTTLTQQITIESSALTDSLVTAKLRESFEQELGNFSPAWHKIELLRTKNASGIPYFRIQLVRKADVRIAKVLSEGEHQCVALAALLAELATADNNSSIVLDEPAAALDRVHRRSVAMRLAEEGRERQVIIFTHDRAFVDLLRKVCKPSADRDAIPIAYRRVSRDADGAGICISWDPEHPSV